jgi:hypothetical protein
MDELDLGQTIRGLVGGQELFGRYLLVRILGRGGMGVVWLARDEKLDRDVALKFLPELVMHDSAVLDDLKRETKRSLELTHHNIVRIYDFTEGNQTACISMEYVDGPTLSALRVERPSKVFEVNELAPWIKQACEALDYAHKRARIVHRDLKPANLMLNSKGHLKLADFGIARSLTDSVSMLTKNRGTSGTLVYMSPQQLDGERTSHLDDIYSLGATLYELLTSKPPFYTGYVDRQIHEKTPPRIADRREELNVASDKMVAPQWEATIAACLSKDPAQRPQSAGELGRRLELSEQATPALAQKKPVPPEIAREPVKVVPRGKQGVIAVALATLLVTGVVGWWFEIGQPRREADRQRQMTAEAEKEQQNKEPSRQREIAEQERPESEKKITTEVEALKTEAATTNEHPYENGLGMRFKAVAGTDVLFSIWETRIRDYEKFVLATSTAWPRPEFKQGPTHPAVRVSWTEADAFCKWLTKLELEKGLLQSGQFYRLPTDMEWSAAVGLNGESGNTPAQRDSVVPGFPWGDQWPPPKGAGNYDPSLKIDEFQFTSPVGSFPANAAGLYDMGGNAFEWCSDWEDENQQGRVVRGGSWADDQTLMSSSRFYSQPDVHFKSYGFRCVLAIGTSR